MRTAAGKNKIGKAATLDQFQMQLEAEKAEFRND